MQASDIRGPGAIISPSIRNCGETDAEGPRVPRRTPSAEANVSRVSLLCLVGNDSVRLILVAYTCLRMPLAIV